MSGFEAQARIVHQSNQIRDEIKSLYAWETDMKQMEAKRTALPDEEAFDQSYPLRNQVQTPKPSTSYSCQPSTSGAAASKSTTTDVSKRKPTAIPNAIEKANEFKTRGNECVKNGQHEKAVKYYTEAINLNKSEPVFYTNRALCYLKQSKFTECIDDCTQAIGLDGKAVKAYYRRMQAREQMPNGDLKSAVDDCKMVLQIEPKNGDAHRSLSRLQKLVNTPAAAAVISKPTTLAIASTSASTSETATKSPINEPTVPTQALWSQYNGKNGYECIDFITKAPHLRSQEPLKRIAFGDDEETETEVAVKVDPKQSSDDSEKTTTTTAAAAAVAPTTVAKPTPSSTPTTPIAHIDQTIKSITKQQKPSSAQPTDLVIPKNSAQFHRAWKSHSNDSQKFAILKGIYNADISKMLGVQFSLDELREIFTVLKSHFIPQNLPIAKILSGIVKNSQMPIISAMMNANDRLAFTDMVEYMRVRGEDVKQIDAIQQDFDNLLSM